MSAAEPRVVAMYLPVAHGKRRVASISAKRWEAIVASFPAQVRGRVANLAAHNWTVFAVDGALLITSPFGGGGYIVFSDARTVPFLPEHNRVLFPPAADQKRARWAPWDRYAHAPDGTYVERQPSEDGLWSLVHAGVFAPAPQVLA